MRSRMVLQIAQFHQQRGVPLDEGPFGGESQAHPADQLGRILAYARRQIVDEPLAAACMRAGEASGPASTSTPRNCRPGHARTQLVDGLHAGRITRQQLLDVAAQVGVKVDGPPDRRYGQQHRPQPEPPPITQRPRHEAPGTRIGARSDGEAKGRGI